MTCLDSGYIFWHFEILDFSAFEILAIQDFDLFRILDFVNLGVCDFGFWNSGVRNFGLIGIMTFWDFGYLGFLSIRDLILAISGFQLFRILGIQDFDLFRILEF